MFFKKSSSVVNELASEMEAKLISNAVEKHDDQFTKTASALDHLAKAAELFDDVGFTKEAEIAVALLEVIAKKKKKRGRPAGSKKKSPTKSKGTEKAPSSAKQVENLKEKGWVFNQSAEDCGDSMGFVAPTQMANDVASSMQMPAKDEHHEPSEDELAQEFDKIMKDLESEGDEELALSEPHEDKLDKDFEEEK